MHKLNKPIFEYSKDIDKKLPDAIKSILGIAVLGLERIEQGAMNYAFKIETEGDPLLVRVFGKKDTVDIDKLVWINQQLEDAQINTPEILGYSVTDEFFPYGFMIAEFIEGKDGVRAINDGDISLTEYFKKLGKVVRKIHSIQVGAYGEINSTENERMNYSGHIISQVESLTSECIATGSLTKELANKIKEKIKRVLLKYENRFKPVFVHGDCGPLNQILSEEGDLFMIDWDYARRGVWFEDLSPVILSAEKFSTDNDEDDIATEIRKSFLEGYGSTDFSEVEIVEIEKTFVIISFLYNLSFYAGDPRNIGEAADARDRVIELLS